MARWVRDFGVSPIYAQAGGRFYGTTVPVRGQALITDTAHDGFALKLCDESDALLYEGTFDPEHADWDGTQDVDDVTAGGLDACHVDPVVGGTWWARMSGTGSQGTDLNTTAAGDWSSGGSNIWLVSLTDWTDGDTIPARRKGVAA